MVNWKQFRIIESTEMRKGNVDMMWVLFVFCLWNDNDQADEKFLVSLLSLLAPIQPKLIVIAEKLIGKLQVVL